MEQFKDAYEISLWGDVLTYQAVSVGESFDEKIIYYEQYTSGGEILYKKTTDETPVEGKTYYVNYYKEEKIGVIGSDSMTAQWRAVEPKLVQNVNGTNTFTFKMFYTYIDTITGERKDNPFQNLLVNERKVKVKWKGKWYDLVIKNCQEDSSGKSVTYTCQDQFINELSKTGFNLEFDNELGNNMGTAQELAQTVLDGTDWQLGEDQDTIKQYREEPVYDISDTWTDDEQVSHNIRFLVFYSVVQNHEAYFQYWYDSSNQYTRDGTSMLVVNGECKSTTASWNENTVTVTIEGHSMEIDFTSLNVSDDYRAKRLVRTQETAYCPALDRYVSKYTYDNDTKVAYGYQTTVYNDPLTVRNIITNGKDFTEALGWSNHVTIPWQIYPPYTASTDVATYDGKSHLGLQTNIKTYNSAIVDHLSSFSEGIIKRQKYVLRLKARGGSASSPEDNYLTQGFNIFVGKFTRSQSGEYSYDGNNYVDVSRLSYDSENHWITYTLTFINSITRSEIGNNFGLIITSNTNKKQEGSNNIVAYDYAWIQEIEFFEYIESGSSYIVPGVVGTSGVVKTEWRYFDESQLNVINADDIEYLDYNEEPLSTIYSPFYGNDDSGAEKVRSISGKNSNRFNWLQTIAETFECWVKFDIEHNNDGSLIYDSGIPRKYVTFVNDIGNQTGLSFIYGIDLNTISRTINSDQIATKVIVSPNSNEFGQDGFCTIARSDENYSKTNFILDFGYYINQGMLSSGQVNLDLYDSTGINGIEYYYFLRQLNMQYDGYNEQYIDISSQLDRYESQKTITEKQIKSTEEEINYLKNRLVNLITSQTSWDEKAIGQKVKNEYANDQSVQQAWTGYISSKNNLASYRNLLTALETQIDTLEGQIEQIETAREGILEDIAALDEKFNTKYARFIQEGSWISEDYYDDNLYYLDAESVAYTSSRPQIQYNINVLRLSALEEFKNKIFNVGDRGYVEDTEFFGYAKDANGNITNTPYKEEILISEITSVFDSPEQDTITVQNYKTQFEDLFQRITATTQSLQYNEGSYARAASIVEPTGEINSWTLAKSFEYNEQLAWRATDDSIVINTTGITAVDTTNPQNMVRLSSAGLQISSDGGVTWTTGVSGAGISTQNLTAGNINVDNIQILSGSYPTFQWNKYGLSAYRFNTDNNGNINNVQTGNFVRHDQYGIYGVNNINDTQWKPYIDQNSNPLNYIRENAAFGMTWDGFFMRNKSYNYVDLNDSNISYYYKDENDQYVQLESEENFQPGVQYYIKEIEEDETVEYIEAFVLESNKVYYILNNNEFYQYSDDFTQDQVYYEKVFGNGYTEISSDGDIIVYDGSYNRIKIGNLGTAGSPIYGISINNAAGFPVMETNDDGTLWLKERLNIGTSNDNYRIGIGNLGPEDEGQLNQVFNANNNFIVYEDGSIVANNGTFKGDISGATGTFSGSISARDGYIGGFAIGENTLISTNNNLILQSQNYPDTYIRTFDGKKEQGKTYYYINNGEYIEFTGESFNDNVIYYEKSGQTINANNNFIVYENGTIVVENGIFSGEVNATSGTFAGDISAASGTLGGFKIEQNKLISTNDINNPSIELNGVDGSIIANNIHLGTGAVIDQYIELGSARIQNPELEGSNNVFITAGNGALQMKDDGIANFGEITISGPESVILGDNFAIRPGLSEFNNVNISGTLKTSVFEVGTVQTVGGMMIFKEGAEIDGSITKIDGEENQYTFKTKEGSITNIKENSIILLTSKNNTTIRQYATVISIETDEINKAQTYIVEANNDITECTNIVQISDYNEEDEKYNNNLLIGVNSNSTDQWKLLRQSFTMRQFNGIQSSPSEDDGDYGDWSDPLLVLGDLSGIADIKPESKIEGFGLYGENVYLTGSLTTEVAQNSYAGVNTLSKVTSTKFGNNDERIVFWAGASENKDEAIQNSPFQVTEKGSIYANSGLFEGAILTKASISASKIYTAHLYGWDTDSSSEKATAPLTIHAKYDSAPGINFVNDSNNPVTTILSINNKGFVFKNEQFVNLEGLNANFIGEFETKNDSIKLNIAQTTISSSSTDGNNTIYGTLVFEQAQNKLSIGNSNITQTNSNLGFNVPTTTISDELIIGTKLDYQKVNNGYDLYVS